MFKQLFSKYFSWISTTLVVLLALIPGSQAGLFNGLPLDNVHMVIVFFLLVSVWLLSWEKVRAQEVLVITLSAFVIVNFLGWLFIPYGWSVCIKRFDKNGTKSSQCENSFRYRSGDKTFTEAKLVYKKNNLPLYFMNDLNLNFYQEGEPDRQYLEYYFEAKTKLRSGKSDILKTYSRIPGVQISLNGIKKVLATGEDEIITLPANQKVDVTIKYQTERSNGHELSVTSSAFPSLSSSAPGRGFYAGVIIYRLMQLILVLVIGSIVLKQFIQHGIILPKNLLLSLALLTVWLLYGHLVDLNPYVTYSVFLIVSIWIFIFKTWTGEVKKTLFAFIASLVFLATVTFVSGSSGYGSLILFPGANDELGHEGFSRVVLFSNTLAEFVEGGEKMLFYYQPLHRYILAFFHAVTGESMWGPYVVQTYIAALAVFMTLAFLRKISVTLTVLVSFMIAVSASVEQSSIFHLTMTPYQQAISTPLVLIAVFGYLTVLAKREKNIGKHFFLSLLAGAVFVTRMDLAPFLIIIPLYYVFAKHLRYDKILLLKTISAAIVGLAFFPLMIMGRNFAVANEAVLFPTSTMVNVLPAFRDEVPYIAGPSRMTGGQVITSIIQRHRGRYAEMTKSLYENVVNNFMGKEASERKIMYLVVAGGALLVFRQNKARKYLIILYAVLVPLLISNAFFLPHNGKAMMAHFDYLIIVIFGLVLWQAGRIVFLGLEKLRFHARLFSGRFD